MKKTIIATIALVVALTGCSSASSDESSESSSPSSAASTDLPASAVDELFVSLVHEAAPVTEELEPAVLVKHGKRACDAMRSGGMATGADMTEFMIGYHSGMETIFTMEETAHFLGYAVGAYCDRYAPLFEEMTR